MVDRLGATKSIPVNVRVIASTNRDLELLIREGKFREDLYDRINVIALRMPPLRERRDDIPLLVDYFLRKFTKDAAVGVQRETLDVLMSYGWPGNVRELESVIERALVLRHGNLLTPDDLPDKLKKEKTGIENIILNLPEEGIELEALEKNLIIKALEKHGNNQTRAAAYLGITRPTLIYRMEKYGLK